VLALKATPKDKGKKKKKKSTVGQVQDDQEKPALKPAPAKSFSPEEEIKLLKAQLEQKRQTPDAGVQQGRASFDRERDNDQRARQDDWDRRMQDERDQDKLESDRRRFDGEMRARATAEDEDRRLGRSNYYKDFRSSDEYQGWVSRDVQDREARDAQDRERDRERRRHEREEEEWRWHRARAGERERAREQDRDRDRERERDRDRDHDSRQSRGVGERTTRSKIFETVKKGGERVLLTNEAFPRVLRCWRYLT
jgi:hypothetical protein